MSTQPDLGARASDTPSPPFLFYSELYRRPVLAPDGTVVGRVDDLAVTLSETYPSATALLVRRGRVDAFHLTARWRDVRSVGPEIVRLHVPVERLIPNRWRPSEPSFWVGQSLLDRQIVDMAGAKVVRVNDLQFLRVPPSDLHLVNVDVGFRGLMRRLGWGSAVDAGVRWLAPRARYLVTERVIPWRYVQLVTVAEAGESLQLNVARRELGLLHPAELADILTELDGREREALFRVLSREAAARALTEVSPGVRQRLLESLDPERAADILEQMPPDEAADALAALPPARSDLLLGKMERGEAAGVEQLLRYEPGTAGGMMTTEFVTLPSTLTAGEALERLRGLAREVELIYYIYLVDASARLRGVVTIRHLLLVASDARLDDIMRRDPVSARPDDTAERVAEITEKYNLLAVPVLDAQGTLLGIVTVDDVLTHMTTLAWKWKIEHPR